MPTYHDRVPRSVEKNLRYRRALLDSIKTRGDREAVRRACADDCLFWINTFCWQYNPKVRRAEVGPFCTYPFQDRATGIILDHIDTGKDLVIEKSRDMGLSWLNLMIGVHKFLFEPYTTGLYISRSERAVEDDSPDSLFWKIDFLLRHLPDWMAPRVKRVKMFFGNEETGSTIAGEASTGKAGVGGRATYMFIDEFAQIREDYEVLHRTADTTDCRIFNSTHKGVGTAFYDLVQRANREGVPGVLRLHWSEHPRKNPGLYQFDREANRVAVKDTAYPFPADYRFVEDGKLRSPWYDRECVRRKDPRQVAQDLDINPQGGLSQFFDPVTIASLVHSSAREPVFVGDLEFDTTTHKPLQTVPVPDGPLRLWVPPTGAGRPPPSRYAMGADISAGTGATPSCIAVADCHTGQKVAEYNTAVVQPEKFAEIAVALGRFFADRDGSCARFAWEFAGPGIVFGKKVVELGYGDIFYRQIETHRGSQGPSDVPGWYPTSDTKRILLEQYRSALYARKYDNPSAYALKECLGYVYTPSGSIEHGGQANANDPSGARTNHGDPVIADALCWKMVAASGLAAAAKPRENQRLVPGSYAWRRKIAADAEAEDAAWI